jgi:hypothetical protein
MGMSLDMSQRVSLSRVDNIPRRSRIAAARNAIYAENLGINSTAVENLLGKDSLVPTAVGLFFAIIPSHSLLMYDF